MFLFIAPAGTASRGFVEIAYPGPGTPERYLWFACRKGGWSEQGEFIGSDLGSEGGSGSRGCGIYHQNGNAATIFA
jgi:hypothetical protein